MKKILKNGLKVLLPFVLGGAIMVWVYKGFDFSRLGAALKQMNWFWLLLSFVFEILSHIIRGLRWQQTLEPLGVHPKTSNCVNAVFLSYASNLVIPRVGEVSRCGVLSKYDGISFAKSLGTVVTERIVDTLIVGLMVGATLLLQMNVFRSFFRKTGTNIHAIEDFILSPSFLILILCIIGVGILFYYLLRTLSFFEKVKGVVLNVWEGVLSLKRVKNLPLFLFWSLAIWGCYFLQFYLTFFCFGFSSGLGILAGFVLFAAGSVAVVVPTPNGAGSWHFAVISMMMLYGVSAEDAGLFALIVHSSQTFLLILLGIWAMVALPITNKNRVRSVKS